jgi:hypothetical protein
MLPNIYTGVQPVYEAKKLEVQTGLDGFLGTQTALLR